MKLCCVVLLIVAAVHVDSEKRQTSESSTIRFPLLDNLKAPLMAELDVSGMNTELKNYIDMTIDKEMKSFSADLRNTTEDSLKNTKALITENVASVVTKVITDIRHSLAKLRLDFDRESNEVRRGTSYTQWGRTKCTSQSSTLVYSGYVGGSSYTGGGAPNKLCLPNEPQWELYDNKVTQSMPFIGATLFDNYDIHVKNSLFDKQYTKYLVQCAVCYTSMASGTVMIPGRTECFGDWKIEYRGYLFAGYPSHKAASEYVCVDESPDFMKKFSTWTDKSILYAVHVKCNGATPCPPYVDGREMTCVVCSK